ncbi:MFS transporter [Streptococcus plurextorum]|uniref:MFS transporter n=1 Tax=Streptococcus plurextorum TaxID=456876 RepID=UPI0003FE9F5A|nr:MFS transporter [Streptococcus plurextorum]
MNTNAKKLLISRVVNKLGDSLYDFGNNSWIASLGTVGQTYLGAYQIADLLVSILINPFGGAISDRFKRRKILLWTDAIGGLMCLVVACLGNERHMLYGLILVNMVLALSSAFSSPSYKAFVPEVVEKEELVSYNAKLETLVQLIKVSSPLVAYWLLRALGIRLTLLLDSATFFVSFITVYLIRVDEAKDSDVKRTPFTIRGILSDIWDGFSYIRKEKEIFFLLIIAAVVNIFAAMLMYLLPFSNGLFASDNAYANLMSFAAIGALSGAFLASRLIAGSTKMLMFLVISGLGYALIGFSALIGLPHLVSFTGNFLAEASMVVFNIHFFSRVQARVSKAYMGRVISTIYTVAILFMPLGTLTMTILPSSVHIASFIWIGLGFCVTGLMAIAYQRRLA